MTTPLPSTMPSAATLDALKARYTACGQAHAVQHLTEDDDDDEILKPFLSVPVEHLAEWHQQATAPTQQDENNTTPLLSPFSGTIAQASEVKETARPIGLQAIAQGQVATLVLAGGQGTRLGYDGPKGCFELISSSSSSGPTTLFGLLASRLHKLSQLAQAPSTIPVYIMTSPLNDATTRAYWKANDNFGLDTVVFFTQGMLPCLTQSDAKIIMETPKRMAMAPDGNGGVYTALPLADMKARGVQYVHAFSIDNALTLPADPVFTGFCIHQQADVGNKVVWRSHAQAAVGVLADKEGNDPCIVDYSDMSPDMAALSPDAAEHNLVYGVPHTSPY